LQGMRVKTYSPEETLGWGRECGKTLPLGSVVALFGDLGAGKTTLIKGIAQGAAGIPLREVLSPTFTYLNIYHGKKTLYHFDLYRLKDPRDFLHLGFDEHFTLEGISLIEWPEKILDLLPPDTLKISLYHLADTERLIEISDHFAI